MSVNGNAVISSYWTQSTTIPGAQPIQTNNTSQFNAASGTGADQASKKYAKTLSLAATPTVLDLTSLVDAEGNAISFAAVRWIKVTNLSTTHTFLVGYATTTTNAWVSFLSNPGQLVVPVATAANQSVLGAMSPGSAGFAVSSSNKLLQLDPGANTISITIEIVGS
jgi:hypothetical protein